MIANRSRSVSLFVVYALVCVTAMVTVKGLWQTNNGNGWTETIRSDAMGYYGYLQAIFIRHDLGHEPFINEYTQCAANGRRLNKYFCGTGIMMAPWFAIGHALAVNDPGVPQDGTSVYEQKAIAIGAWVYLLMGLLALRALLLGSGVRDGLVAWVLAGLALGTPLIQYERIGGCRYSWADHTGETCEYRCGLGRSDRRRTEHQNTFNTPFCEPTVAGRIHLPVHADRGLSTCALVRPDRKFLGVGLHQ